MGETKARRVEPYARGHEKRRYSAQGMGVNLGGKEQTNGWRSSPAKYVCLEPQNVESVGLRVFVDVIKGRTLR